MDGILLNRVTHKYRALFQDDGTRRSLIGIIEGRGGFGSIRGLDCYELPEQLWLCTGLTCLDIDLDDLLRPVLCATPVMLPNLLRLTLEFGSPREALAALELEDVLQTKGSASLHLRVVVVPDEIAAYCGGALRSITGSCKQSIETITLIHYSDGFCKQTYEILRELLPALSNLQRLFLDINLVSSMMRLINLALPPLLQYIEVKCGHVSARVGLCNIARLADASTGATFYPFVLRCDAPKGPADSLAQEHRARDARKAITAWKEKRGIQVPELVAQSWLECECNYW